MYLDRIDIDQHGPLSQLALGPFSAGLNAIIAAAGSGKSALVRFLRDSLTGTTPSRDGLRHSKGSVSWAAADGVYHCRREPNGTPHGHRSVSFQSKLGATQHHQLARNVSVVFDLPMCVVDGIVTDTKQSRVQHCVDAVIQSGLDSMSPNDRSYEQEIAQLQREIAALERQIDASQLHARHASAVSSRAYQSYGLTADMHSLRARRAALVNEIAAIDARREWAHQAATEQARKARKRKLFANLTKDIQRLRDEQSQLTLKLEEVEAKLAQNQQADAQAANRATIAKAYRNRLNTVESQLAQLRTVAGEIRSLGRLWFGDRTRLVQHDVLAANHPAWPQLPSDLAYDTQADTLEAQVRAELALESNHWVAGGYEPVMESSVPEHAYRVEQRIDAICRIVDQMVGQCDGLNQTSVQPLVDRFDSLSQFDSADVRSADPNTARMNESLVGANSADPADEGEWYQINHGLDQAERLLAEERQHQARVVVQQPDGVSNFASTLNGISQRMRGLMGRHAAYGSRNIDPTFHGADVYSITHPLNDRTELDPQARLAALARCEQEVVQLLRAAMARRQVIIQRIAEALRVPATQVIASYTDQQLDHDDPRLYQQLVRDRIVADEFEAKQRAAADKRLVSERDSLRQKLERVSGWITDRVAEAETIRLYLRSQPVVKVGANDEQLRQRLVAELDAIDALLRQPQIDRTVLERHAQAIARLRELQAATNPRSGIAAAASAILRQLSGGALQQVRWQLKSSGDGIASVQIDGQNEMARSSHDRELASIAVRLAAADELARRGRDLPVIIEVSGGIGSPGRSPYPTQNLVAVLNEAARRGRQIVLLTDDSSMVQFVQRAGGAIYSLTGHYPNSLSASSVDLRPQPWRGDYSVASFLTSIDQPSQSGPRLYDVNSDFDLAWREAQGDDLGRGFEERNVEPVVAPERPANSESNQGGASIANTARSSQANDRVESSRQSSSNTPSVNGRLEAADVPFSLTGSSLIDAATNIDATATARLKALGVLRVDELLGQNPKELAERLNLPGVDSAMIRRWQHECRLLVGVRNLTPYPAKVLVGCGISHPRELAETDFAVLAERIEAYLATDRGRQLSQSVSTAEQVRLQDWVRNHRSRSERPVREASSTGHKQTSEPRAGVRNDRDKPRDADRSPKKATSQSGRFNAIRRQVLHSENKAESKRSGENATGSKLKFYLQRNDDVEAAPSIGPRMAERLHKIGVNSVGDLLGRSAESIAAALQHSKINADQVRQWQQQATLVCRVPTLRGHDAQLLVAAGVTTPEKLAQCESGWLLTQVEPIAHSAEGKAILRGGKLPDLAEVQAWIDSSQHKRELVVA